MINSEVPWIRSLKVWNAIFATLSPFIFNDYYSYHQTIPVQTTSNITLLSFPDSEKKQIDFNQLANT